MSQHSIRKWAGRSDCWVVTKAPHDLPVYVGIAKDLELAADSRSAIRGAHLQLLPNGTVKLNAGGYDNPEWVPGIEFDNPEEAGQWMLMIVKAYGYEPF